MERNQRSSPDIISNLPSNVTENILKGLPLRDAVRTSVLSSRWRYKWVTIPQLVFNHQFFLNWWDNDLNCWDKEKLKAVIYQVLLFHQGPLVEFKLCFFQKHPPSSRNVHCFAFLDTKVKQPEEETYSKWVKFFRSLPAIEDMHLNSSFLESFDAGSVPKRLPCTLNQLKVLALSDFCHANLDHVSWALCLLRSSPNLHRLQSCIFNVSPIQDHATEFLQAQDFSLNQLQEVEIRNFSGAEPELCFVKILLAHSVVLKKMVILHERGMSDEKGFAMVKELTQFPRSSSDSVLVVDVRHVN